ncbi:MAG: restriction endonuclease, partial [Moorea sp. SIO2I5]|nr:restriction endonuclease [Moorena sp. SIO2I5]
ESQAAGFIPVLLVLDPTPSNRLTELSEKYLACGGAFYHGEEAWRHMEQEAGEVVSVFIERYIKPAIQGIEEIEIEYPKSINLRWSDQVIEISDDSSSYVINRL